MTRASTPALLLARALSWLALSSLAVITLASPGATRMFAWPWSLAFGAALLAPVLALLTRALDRQHPLLLPALPWSGLALGTAGLVLASALASPHRDTSVLWCAPWLGGLAAFFLFFDLLHGESAPRARLAAIALIGGGLVATTSLVLWFVQGIPARDWLEARNPFPLGHSNYTAGLGLLLLPLATATAGRARGARRALSLVVVVLGLALIFSSGSRGGFIGLAAAAGAALWLAPLAPRKKAIFAAAGLITALAFALGHPRTRATLFGGAGTHLVAASEVQRTAMLTAGSRMGADRPLLGWGPGTTPLVYPKYRGGLAGGAENVLQLHCLPVHLWAELGLAGVLALFAGATLALRHAARHPTAAVTLFGYAAFSLTDWQLDVPVFAAAIAASAALLAPPADDASWGDKPAPRLRWLRPLIAGLTLAGLAVVTLLGRRDPTPELNLRALALAGDPAQADRAIALLRASLALNPDQEIAHFNLGWLLLVRAPAAAEKHFAAAAHLVPDKGGVYFGLGLARLNLGQPAAAARTLALECLNEPKFLSSPWWREPAIATVRAASADDFAALLREIAPLAPPHPLAAADLGRVPPGPERVYRRQRTGYPVLMRNLDLATPTDLYDVRETAAPPAPGGSPLPPKGWLPSPLLLRLLDAPVSPKP